MSRAAVVPKGFGKFGHYRPAALDAIRAKPIAYAGQDTCVLCHEDQAKVRAAGRHAHVRCEACHGPQAKCTRPSVSGSETTATKTSAAQRSWRPASCTFEPTA